MGGALAGVVPEVAGGEEREVRQFTNDGVRKFRNFAKRNGAIQRLVKPIVPLGRWFHLAGPKFRYWYETGTGRN